ncbi:hypothetical protein D0Y65_039983 [Glycine soja]|uniref:Uncharacterized protein n=1 Tax=Glycine soja TaxID=3848 RepID=A0A445GPE0_GLYSO|nr:hypothetical protein D0Y65_039983 [Glycine soja]
MLITHSAHVEGWSLAESFCVRCIVAAPYVVPYRGVRCEKIKALDVSLPYA